MYIKFLGAITALLLAAAFVVTSCGGSSHSSIGPTVISVTPKNGATNVSTGSLITATFNVPLSPNSINSGTFYATAPGGVALPGTVTFNDRTATLQLASPMPMNTLITATITTGVKNLANQDLEKNYVWSFTTGSTDAAPTVVSTVPVASATGVSLSSKVSATFSEAMNPVSINGTSFTLTSPGGAAVPATVTYANSIAVLTPTTALVANTVYTATVTTEVTDVAGTPMAAPYTWTFTTAAADIPPTVVSTIPVASATNVSISTVVSATFSAAMQAASINGTTFSLATSTGTAVPATVTYANDVATLTPTAALAAGTAYTATVTTGVKDVAGTPMAAPYTWTFTTAEAAIPPVVVSTIPLASATNVLATTKVSATFSVAMQAASINGTTFSLATSTGTVVPATVTYANSVATLTPTTALAGGAVYTATVTTGVKDTAGTAMANPYVWSFTTDTPPTVIANTPLAGAVGVLAGSKVTATFSKAMSAASITTTTFKVAGPTNVAVPATVTYSNGVATLTPTSPLALGTLYTATVTTGAKDVAGTSLANTFTWSFTTDIAPFVVSTFPVNNQTQVGVTNSVTATFNEILAPSSVNGTTFTLKGPGGVTVPATITYVNKVATLSPTSPLAGTTLYTATLTTGIKSAAGTPMVNPFIWTFTTGQAPINLGTAGTYGILGGSTVTNIGPTNIVGDIGVSPGTAITGFPPGTLTGVIHAGDAVAATAKADLLAASTDAASRLNANNLPGDISGLTITPGLYKNATSVLLGVGSNVTFDAKGDANAVFILQMGSTLTTGVGSTVTLIGGAQAKNIFWSVGSSATLGVNSTIAGNVLAQASITANTGTTIQGRLLTNIAAVTLDSNNVTVPPRRFGGARK